MDKRVMYTFAVLGAAAFGYYWFTKRSQASDQQPQDQTPTMVAEKYYNPPPSFSAQPQREPGVFLNQKQVLPLPYNT